MANIINKGCFELKVGYTNMESSGFGNSFTPVTEVFGSGGPSWGNGSDGTHPQVEIFYPDGEILSATVFNSTNNPEFTGNFNSAPQHAPSITIACNPAELENTVTVQSTLDADAAFAVINAKVAKRGASQMKGTASSGFFSFRLGDNHMYGAYSSSGNTWNFSIINNPSGKTQDYPVTFTSLVNPET